MKQQPDKLFRDKLAGYQKAAPADAWDRIDAGLSKKTNASGLWLKIAASLLLLAIAAFMLWPEDGTTPSQKKLAQKKQALPDSTHQLPANTPADEGSAGKPMEVPVLPNNENQIAATEMKPAATRKVKQKSIQPEPAVEQNNPARQQPVATDDLISHDAQAIASTHEETETPVPVTASPTEENIKLVFSADESDEYLNKKSLAEATSHDKKPSTLKKLLKKAEGLATNQDPFGELRQKKNEILALNFKNDKQRGQNK